MRNINEVHKADRTKQLLNTNTKRRHMMHSSRKIYQNSKSVPLR